LHVAPAGIAVTPMIGLAEAGAYLRGPLPFMATVPRSLLDRGVADERIRYEVFGPARDLVVG
jgi:ferredoxin-NADP reductase